MVFVIFIIVGYCYVGEEEEEEESLFYFNGLRCYSSFFLRLFFFLGMFF